MGKGLEGKGRGSNRGPITMCLGTQVAIRYAWDQQVTRLSRQRPRVRVPSSPPFFWMVYKGPLKPIWVRLGPISVSHLPIGCCAPSN